MNESTRHVSLGANVEISPATLLATSALNSTSATRRYSNSSPNSTSTFPWLTNEYTSCSALRLMVMSLSFTHSTIVRRCRCTASASCTTTFARALSATYRTLLSLSCRNLPRTFTANTRKPPTLSHLTMVRTASYRTAFPAFLPTLTFAATFASVSLIWSEVSGQPSPSTPSNFSNLTCRNGSCCPPTSCSALYAPCRSARVILISSGTFFRNLSKTTVRSMPSWVDLESWDWRVSLQSVRIRVTAASKTPWCLSSSKASAPSTNDSASSGTFLITRTAQSAAFLST
mmetsp:Transcript_289/g.1096  ORF Transcript_289/g.1096 Transcript_289/m.1096 type:complete len:287 (+) Transcript_289:782-1642(+)